jgi:hypothetical protein
MRVVSLRHTNIILDFGRTYPGKADFPFDHAHFQEAPLTIATPSEEWVKLNLYSLDKSEMMQCLLWCGGVGNMDPVNQSVRLFSISF